MGHPVLKIDVQIPKVFGHRTDLSHAFFNSSGFSKIAGAGQDRSHALALR